jgi:hypothetical protein
MKYGMVTQAIGRHENIKHWATAAGLLAVIACAGCSSGASHDPPTHAQIADRAATGEYLRAREALIRSSMAELPAGRGPMAAFVTHVRAECPDALSGTPVDRVTPLARNTSLAQLRAQLKDARFSMEIEQGLEAAEREPQAAEARRFATTVASIRWSDPRIADLVNTFAQIELQRRHMPQLDVCRKIREWASSGYRRLPASIPAEPRGAIGRRWIRDVAALGCGKFSPANPREVLRALRLYQQPGGHPTTRDVEVMEIHLTLEESRARAKINRSLAQALGISASWPKSSRRPPSTTGLNAFPELPGCSGKPDLLSEEVKEPAGGNMP